MANRFPLTLISTTPSELPSGDGLDLSGNTIYNSGAVITLPTATGTLSTLAGTESLSNKTITSSSFNGTTVTATTITGGTITETSDERLKTNVVQLTNCLDIVNQLEGKAYIKDGRAMIGLIAQQVEKIIPQVVLTASDEMSTKSVAYGNIVAILIEAIKEQQTQIEELKKRLG